MSDLLDFSPPGQATFSLAGAKARFFDAGTTNPRTVYADEAETIPHPSPLLADSSGRFAQAFVSGGAVKVVVTQADDSTGYTLDPCVKVAATGSAANAISFTPSVLRPQTTVQDAIDSGTFPARTITAGTAISVTNGDGVSGNPTIAFNRGAPVTKTADFTIGAAENWLINNKSGSACVVTLPAAASFTGREIMIQNLQAQAVNSASSNVIPLGGGSAGAAILPACIGARATLVSDGTNWRVVDFYLPQLGDGQTWQDVTASRAANTTYTNTTGRPIMVSVRFNAAAGNPSLEVNGLTIATVTSQAGIAPALSTVVPSGATYRASHVSTTTLWAELR